MGTTVRDVMTARVISVPESAGQVESRSVALHLLGAVRNVEGTVAVRDRLSYPAD